MSDRNPRDKALVTGAAGFIGSHLCRRLVHESMEVQGLDNLSSGTKDNVSELVGARFELVIGDVQNQKLLRSLARGSRFVFHLAANPDIRTGRETDFEQNLRSTYALLEALRHEAWHGTLIFASSSTIYGDASVLPTPETYGPLAPISVYGATKLGCEALITAYSHIFGFEAVILRLANVVGPRSKHGVIHDFVEKLRQNPAKLDVLGDGTQAKSYIYIEDCIEAFIRALERREASRATYNVGTTDQTDVRTIAEIVIADMGLKDVRIDFRPGRDGRGWPGDVKRMLLDISRLHALGWTPRYGSTHAVRRATREILRPSRWSEK